MIQWLCWHLLLHTSATGHPQKGFSPIASKSNLHHTKYTVTNCDTDLLGNKVHKNIFLNCLQIYACFSRFISHLQPTSLRFPPLSPSHGRRERRRIFRSVIHLSLGRHSETHVQGHFHTLHKILLGQRGTHYTWTHYLALQFLWRLAMGRSGWTSLCWERVHSHTWNIHRRLQEK